MVDQKTGKAKNINPEEAKKAGYHDIYLTDHKGDTTTVGSLLKRAGNGEKLILEAGASIQQLNNVLVDFTPSQRLAIISGAIASGYFDAIKTDKGQIYGIRVTTVASISELRARGEEAQRILAFAEKLTDTAISFTDRYVTALPQIVASDVAYKAAVPFAGPVGAGAFAGYVGEAVDTLLHEGRLPTSEEAKPAIVLGAAFGAFGKVLGSVIERFSGVGDDLASVGPDDIFPKSSTSLGNLGQKNTEIKGFGQLISDSFVGTPNLEEIAATSRGKYKGVGEYNITYFDQPISPEIQQIFDDARAVFPQSRQWKSVDIYPAQEIITPDGRSLSGYTNISPEGNVRVFLTPEANLTTILDEAGHVSGATGPRSHIGIYGYLIGEHRLETSNGTIKFINRYTSSPGERADYYKNLAEQYSLAQKLEGKK